MKYRIAHVGAFDFENFGDLLFTDVLKKKLEERIEIGEIVYFAPKTCKMPGKNESVHSITKLEKMMEENPFDAIIVGGGDLVHMRKIRTYMPHISEDWVDYEVIYLWVVPSLVAQKYNIPLIWNAPGVPLDFSKEEAVAASWLCKNVDYISVRDQISKKTLSCVTDADRINVVPDTVLCIRDIILEDELIQIFRKLSLDMKKKEYIFFQGNKTLSDEDIKTCADMLFDLKNKTGYKIILQPIGYALGDIEVLEKVSNIYQNEFIFIRQKMNQYEILALIANAALYVGASLHGCITANSYGVKNIVYNYNRFSKVDGFVDLIGREDTRVYNSKDIIQAYDGLRDVCKEEMNEYIYQIERHFDRIAEIIKHRVKVKIEYISKDIAEYIFCASEKIVQLQKEIEAISVEKQGIILENKRIRKENTELWKYKKAYDEVVMSFSWRFMKPVRNIMDSIKQRH